MKNKYIFAVSQTKRKFISIESVAIFMAILLVLVSAKIKESSIHNGLLHSCFSFSWSRCGEMALFLYIYLNFHYMTKRNEKVSKVNNSTLTTASVHDTDFEKVAQQIINQIKVLIASSTTQLSIYIIVGNNNIVGNSNVATNHQYLTFDK